MARAKNNKKQNPDSQNRRQELENFVVDEDVKAAQPAADDAELDKQLADMISDLRAETAELDLSEYTNPKSETAPVEVPVEFPPMFSASAAVTASRTPFSR